MLGSIFSALNSSSIKFNSASFVLILVVFGFHKFQESTGEIFSCCTVPGAGRTSRRSGGFNHVL